jgi:hypothetical protein
MEVGKYSFRACLRVCGENCPNRRVFPSGELITLRSGWFSLFQPFRTPEFKRFAPVELPDRCRLATPLGNRLFMPPPSPA